jgi:hypothetical protein
LISQKVWWLQIYKELLAPHELLQRH